MKKYEVYKCCYKGKVVYVGSGANGRHKHCNSGVSHVFELNKIFFLEGVDSLDVQVVKNFSDRNEAYDYEEYLIKSIDPVFNKKYTTRSHISLKTGAMHMRAKFKLSFIKHIGVFKLNKEFSHKINDAIDHFMMVHDHQYLMENGLLFRHRNFYYGVRSDVLYNILRNCIANKNSSVKTPTKVWHIFINSVQLAYRDIYTPASGHQPIVRIQIYKGGDYVLKSDLTEITVDNRSKQCFNHLSLKIQE